MMPAAVIRIQAKLDCPSKPSKTEQRENDQRNAHALPVYLQPWTLRSIQSSGVP